MTDTSKSSATGGGADPSNSDWHGGLTGPSNSDQHGGLTGPTNIGFLLEFIGAAAVIGAAFFSPLPERIAVLAGVGAFAAGRFFPRIAK
jgi:hypothetical protein